MIDPKLLRDNLEQVAKNLAQRGFELPISKINYLEEKRKSLQSEVENLQSERNSLSKKIGELKMQKQDATNELSEVKIIGDKLDLAHTKLVKLQASIQQISLTIPNLLAEDVPFGKSEQDNKEIKKAGDVPSFDFDVLDHVDLGARDNMLDMEAGAKLSGSRFAVLRQHVALMHRALAQFMLDVHIQQHGYSEVSVPLLVNLECLEGTGQLPKFAQDQFYTQHANHHYGLIPTAEVPVTNLVRDTLLSEEELPLKFVAHSNCFRSEAGSYGRDTRGMIRMHQFEKVELVQICRPQDSAQFHEELLSHAEKILQLLELPYRIIVLCSQDTGFSAAKTYDLEVWLPSQNRYCEISSCSNFHDFQARRIKARYKDSATQKNSLVHTLNGSGLAVGRALVAVMENYQQADGSILVPKVLQPYMYNMTQI